MDPTIDGLVHSSLIPLPAWISNHTCFSAIEHVLPRYRDWKCMAIRKFLENGKRGEYIWEDYETVFHKMKALALGLKELGLKKGDRIGIMSVNRPEWTILDMACTAIGCISVPIYDSYGPDNCEYIMTTTETVCVFCAMKTFDFIKEATERCSFVSNVVLFDGTPTDDNFITSNHLPKQSASRSIDSCGFTYFFSEVIAKGEALLKANPSIAVQDPSVQPTDMTTIIFTSGTSGRPKGAMLSHSNLLNGGWSYMIRKTFITKQDTIISYLPLAHVFERSIEIFALTSGIGIGYFSGSIPHLTEDIALLKPTLFPAVPRVLIKVYSTIIDTIEKSGTFKKTLFKTALYLKEKSIYNDWPLGFLADPIFEVVKKKFGGNLRIIFVGSAPLNPKIGHFLNLVLGARVLEGYGQTEACGASFSMGEQDHFYGSVGHLLAGVEAKLESVQEMGYFAEDTPPKGELLLRGKSVFLGYWNDAEATKKTLVDGWLHTGDVGMWLPNGQLKIIDRLKNVFKLQQGEFVYVEDIEGCLSSSSVVAQIVVHGDSLMSGLVAVIHPNRAGMFAFAKEHGLIEADSEETNAVFEELCARKECKTFILGHVRDTLKAAGRKGYEIPVDAIITPIECTIENGQLTPSYKYKRDAIKTAYANELEAMCSKLR